MQDSSDENLKTLTSIHSNSIRLPPLTEHVWFQAEKFPFEKAVSGSLEVQRVMELPKFPASLFNASRIVSKASRPVYVNRVNVLEFFLPKISYRVNRRQR